MGLKSLSAEAGICIIVFTQNTHSPQHSAPSFQAEDETGETDGQRHPVVLPPGRIKVAQSMGSIDVTFWPQDLFYGSLVRKWGGSLAPAIIQAQVRRGEIGCVSSGQGHKLGKSGCHRSGAGGVQVSTG